MHNVKFREAVCASNGENTWKRGVEQDEGGEWGTERKQSHIRGEKKRKKKRKKGEEKERAKRKGGRKDRRKQGRTKGEEKEKRKKDDGSEIYAATHAWIPITYLDN